jgi:flagellar motor switch protein FliN/FliY
MASEDQPLDDTSPDGPDSAAGQGPSQNAAPGSDQRDAEGGADDVQDASRLADEAMQGAQQAASDLDSAAGEGDGNPESAALAAAMEAIRMAQGEGSEQANQSGPGGASPLDLPSLSADGAITDPQKLDLLSDVNVTVKIELGRTRMLVEDVLKLGDGAVVELEKLAGDPVDIFVNDRPIARGEVLVLNDNFCVRVNEILDRSSEEND